MDMDTDALRWLQQVASLETAREIEQATIAYYDSLTSEELGWHYLNGDKVTSKYRDGDELPRRASVTAARPMKTATTSVSMWPASASKAIELISNEVVNSTTKNAARIAAAMRGMVTVSVRFGTIRE